MKLTPDHYAILNVLRDSDKELKGIDIYYQVSSIRFSKIHPLLKDLEKIGLITGRTDYDDPEPLTGACPRYFQYNITGETL